MNQDKAPEWSRTIPFKVDVAGVIHIMGTALYSRPSAAIRELIQNAHDAIMRRRKSDLKFTGRIDIVQLAEEGILEIHDDGVGLSAEEAEAYLGTLGVGITGLLKGSHPDSEVHRANETLQGDGTGLIGQFGIGLFSAFMLANEIEVISRRSGSDQAVLWKAGVGTHIQLSSAKRDEIGTTIRLRMLPEQELWTTDASLLEQAVKHYADFLPIPIYLNHGKARINVIQSQWFDPTPDREMLESEFATYFDESPLDVIPLHVSRPVPISGALYVTPQRTPGFSDESDVTATVMRMVISSSVEGLIPHWASFLRGVLDLPNCSPTASREELVRDEAFEQAAEEIEELLFEHFEDIALSDPLRFASLLNWHRYSWTGAALMVPRLRLLLSSTYRFATSQGDLTAEEIIKRSAACPIRDPEYDSVVWYNSDRRQERWIGSLFARQSFPCVFTVRSFEESLLAAMIADELEDKAIDLRLAHPSSLQFASQIVEAEDIEPAPAAWSEFLSETNAKIMCADFREDTPVLAFLNEKQALKSTFDELKKQGSIPSNFQRLIDRQFSEDEPVGNEVLLNRRHKLVARALEKSTLSPLASVLRLLVIQSLNAAGASNTREMIDTQVADLDWIADALWGKNS